jgi:eukaryotic-like serine/threonine-protein kinase
VISPREEALVTKQKNRRRSEREVLEPVRSAILYPRKRKNLNTANQQETLLVSVFNLSRKGVLLLSLEKYEVNSSLDMRIWHPQKNVWMAVEGKVKWIQDAPYKKDSFLAGIEFDREMTDEDACRPEADAKMRHISPDDLDFILHTKFFSSLPQDSICPLLNSLTSRRVNAGERIITQGSEGDSLYIIRKGSCVVNIEKGGVLHPVARLKAGDIVGEMAVLTGEPRSSHVDAETDMDMFRLMRSHFDQLSEEYPDMRNLLTEIITQRFASSKLTANRTIGKYIIHDVLGQGGWSIVYKGMHETLNFSVAIKMLKHNMAMDPEFQEKFRNEAKTIARLNHANIVKVYDIEELYRTVFIVMEYLEGFTLEYLMEHMPKLSFAGVVDIILRICSGLEYAHQQGIVHQDLKPANVFMQSEGQIKIVDFGLACPQGNIDFDLPGTIFYMAPEQIEGKPVDERTDIYSLGIMVYELLTGKRPFPEDDLGRLMDFHLKEDSPDPRSIVPDLPDELYTMIMKSIRKDPSERYGRMSEITAELQPLADRLDLRCACQTGDKGKMKGLFVFYRDEHELLLNKLIDRFNRDVSELGAVLRVTHLEDV